MNALTTVESRDGTMITYETHGSGRPLVLVEPSLHSRATSAFAGLVPLLREDFTVVTYDRRGRGGSTDTPPYSPAREVEDLDAVVAAVGAGAHVYSHSSGALLALHGAAAGVPISRMALLEPPLHEPGHDFTRPDPLTRQLRELIDRGERAGAVLHFLRSIGVPEEVVDTMTGGPRWPDQCAMAHTLVYDCLISDATTPSLLASADVPTLVLDSAGSTDDLTTSAAQAAAQLPDARRRILPGEWHGVADDVLAPVLVEFFQSGE